jgi:hypothetical protein
MNLIPLGPLDAGVTLTTDKNGYEHVLVVAKVTFLVQATGECIVAQDQARLVYADEFEGDPATTAMIFESDFAPFKAKCDVLVNGKAFAPNGQPARRVNVSLKVGPIRKDFTVVGNRIWRRRLFWMIRSAPEPFTEMRITYSRAYGGTDVSPRNPERMRAYVHNPVGVGYYPLCRRRSLIGKPVPNTEELRRPIASRRASYRPMSFGPIGRNYKSRASLTGTYDKQWLDDVYPFLPADFDEGYYQAAPLDQQMNYPSGGEQVEMLNLTPEGRLNFRLPSYDVPMRLVYRTESEELSPVIDTVIIEPDLRRCMLVWRATHPLRCKPTQILEVWVGTPTRGRLLALQNGKDYRASLGRL